MGSETPVVLMEGLRTPECLRWHDGWLWFSDINARRVYRMRADGTSELFAQFDDYTGGLGFLPNGNLIVALRTRRQLVEVDGDGKRRTYMNLGDQAGDELNDIVVDGHGRAYLDNIFRTGPDEPEPTRHARDTLLFVSERRAASTVADQLVRPNGMAITPDGSTLILASTRFRTLAAFTIGRDGSLTDRRVYADPGEEVTPDGICVDEENAVWFGSPYTNQVIRVRPDGTIPQRIRTGSKRCTCVTLGGANRRTLFMSTWLVRPDHPRSPTLEDHAETRGWIEAIEVDVPGAGWP